MRLTRLKESNLKVAMDKSEFSPSVPPDRPIGCLSKPRCRIQALTLTNNTRARPQPAAPPRRFNSQDVIFLFLSRALSRSPSLPVSFFLFFFNSSFFYPLLSFSLSAMSQLFLKGMVSPLLFPSLPPSSQNVSRQKYNDSRAITFIELIYSCTLRQIFRTTTADKVVL